MAKVKGSKQPTLKVVKHRPGLRWIYGAVGVLLLSLVGLLAFFVGSSGDKVDGSSERWEPLLAEARAALAASEKVNSDLRQELVNVKLGAEVDRQASERTRQEVIEFKTQLTELKEANSFYRSLMAPTKNKRGLTFGDVEFFEADKPGFVSYAVLVKQLATSHNVLKGALTLTIVGTQDGLERRISLREVSESVEVDEIKLRFKYFQEIKGELALPEGFEASRVELVARSKGKNAVTIEKQVGWLVQKQR